MKHLACAVLFMFLCSGCGGGDTHDSLTAASLGAMKELVTTLESMKDEASANAAKPKLKSLAEQMNGLNERQAKLKAPTEAEAKAIDEKYGKEMEDLQMRLTQSLMRIQFDPKLSAALNDIELKPKN